MRTSPAPVSAAVLSAAPSAATPAVSWPAPAGGPPVTGRELAGRIARFYAAHPSGRIVTDLVTRAREAVVFRAAIYRDLHDAQPAATGWAASGWGVGPAFERAEEAAVGRALGHLGFASGAGRPPAEAPPPDDVTPARLAAASGAFSPAWDALVADLLVLVGRAERYGLRPRRAAAWRARLRLGRDDEVVLAEAERRLRAWLERRRAEPYLGAV